MNDQRQSQSHQHVEVSQPQHVTNSQTQFTMSERRSPGVSDKGLAREMAEHGLKWAENGRQVLRMNLHESHNSY